MSAAAMSNSSYYEHRGGRNEESNQKRLEVDTCPMLSPHWIIDMGYLMIPA
jgi:hypothetical protein